MIYILTYVIIYAPPLLAGYFFYRRQKKKQEASRHPNAIMLFLGPCIIFTVVSMLWSGALYGIAYLATQG